MGNSEIMLQQRKLRKKERPQHPYEGAKVQLGTDNKSREIQKENSTSAETI